MSDLKFPVFDEPLPPTHQVSIAAYLAFVTWHLNRMGPEQRKRELARRRVPSGERFSLSSEG